MFASGCSRSSADARAAQPYVRQFAEQLRQDGRFRAVEVGVWELGDKGPVYVRGRVRSDSDATELRRSFDALHCPVGVSWQVIVDTNISGDTK